MVQGTFYIFIQIIVFKYQCFVFYRERFGLFSQPVTNAVGENNYFPKKTGKSFNIFDKIAEIIICFHFYSKKGRGDRKAYYGP